MSYAIDSLRTLIIRIALIFVNIVNSVILVRALGPKGVGIFALLLLVPSFCFRFGNFGMGSSFAYFIARKRGSTPELFKIAGIASVLMALTCIGLILIIWKNHFLPWHDISPRLFSLVIITIPLMFFLEFFQKILSGQLNIKALNISEIIRNVSYAILLASFLLFLELGVVGAIYAYILSQLFALIYVLIRIKRHKDYSLNKQEKNHNANLSLELFRYGKWNYLIMLNNFFLEQFPLMALKFFSSNEMVGLFVASRRISDRISILPKTFANILFPFTAGSDEDEGVRRTNTLCRNFLIIMGVISLLLAVSAEPLIVLLYGKDFRYAAKVFYALLPGFFFIPLSKFTVVHIAASGKSKLASLGSFLALPGGLISALVLIPLYGPVGAAFSYSITISLIGLISLFIYKRTTKSNLREIIMPKRSDWHLMKKFFLKNLYTRNIHSQKAQNNNQSVLRK